MPITSVDIRLAYPPNNIFRPGEAVSGDLRYVLDKEMYVMNIVISLKGLGRLCIKQTKIIKRKPQYTDYNNVTYVDLDKYVLSKPGYVLMPPGEYTSKFTFVLPTGIPPTYHFSKHIQNDHSILCKVFYYIRVRFDRPNYIFNKHYKKEIQVGREIVSSQLNLTKPTLIKISKVIKSQNNEPNETVNVDIVIPDSTVTPNGIFAFMYEVKNNSSFPVNVIDIKLLELHQVKAMNNVRKRYHENVVGVNFNRNPIEGKKSRMDACSFIVPSHLFSYTDNKMITRSYILMIIFGFNGIAPNYYRYIPVAITETLENTILDFNQEEEDEIMCEAVWENLNEYEKAEFEKEYISIDLPVANVEVDRSSEVYV